MGTKILINGNFLARDLTGIERFAWEVCRRLDEFLQADDDVNILVPPNALRVPDYRRIQPVIAARPLKSFPRWDLYTVAAYCKRLGATALSFSNTAPLGKKCGIAFLHDIYARDCPQDFSTAKERLIRAYSLLHYQNIVRNARHVVTVSAFSRGRIQAAYGVADDRISVIGNGWEHIMDERTDEHVFERFPTLLTTPYYFTLGSISKRKNLAWIARYAAAHPAAHFAVSGKAISGGLVPAELGALQKLHNVTLVGYLNDGEIKALMQRCKALVFPSYYEGFGIPPLEALALATPVVISRSASLPEIYGSAAHYIDADTRTAEQSDLDALLAKPVADPHPVLARYTYTRAAEQLYALITQYDGVAAQGDVS